MAILLQSCITNVDLELPLHNSIVLNGLLVPGDTILVTLHRSGVNTDTTGFSVIDNASVALFEDGLRKNDLQYRGNGIYSSRAIANALSTYKIEVNTPEQEKVWAETTIPERSFGAEIKSQKELDSKSRFNWPFVLTLSDNALYNNQYWVCDKQFDFTPDSVSRRYLSGYLNTNSVYIDQFNVTYDVEGLNGYYFNYKNFMLIDDKQFQGETITIEFVPLLSGTLKQDSFIVYNLDVHYSNYLKSKMINEEGGDNLTENGPPISYKPAFVYSNVHGGFGILGSYTSYTKTYQYK